MSHDAAAGASRESSRPSVSASPPTIRTSPPPPEGEQAHAIAHAHAQSPHPQSAAAEAIQGQPHSPQHQHQYQQHDFLGPGEQSNVVAPDALRLTSTVPALDYFKRHWYKDWFRDRTVENTDPYGFSSAGTSRNITRTQTPLPPVEGNYEAARRNSLATAATTATANEVV